MRRKVLQKSIDGLEISSLAFPKSSTQEMKPNAAASKANLDQFPLRKHKQSRLHPSKLGSTSTQDTQRARPKIPIDTPPVLHAATRTKNNVQNQLATS
jgi:hypothetical protein